MVPEAGAINTVSTTLKFKYELNCGDYGIYAARCKICQEVYVGQTCTSFSTRWTGHRSTWAKFNFKDDGRNDKTALCRHYAKLHCKVFKRKPAISDCFEVFFVDKPPRHKLDVFEAKWLKLLNATINIDKMILPKYR